MSSRVVFDQSYRGSQSLFVIGDKNKHFHDDCRAVCSVLMMIAHLPMYWLLASCPEPAVPANNLLPNLLFSLFPPFVKEHNFWVEGNISFLIHKNIQYFRELWRKYFLVFCEVANKLLSNIHFPFLPLTIVEENYFGFEKYFRWSDKRKRFE